MLADVETVLRHIQPIDPEWICRAELRQASLTKPPGSLGRLEEVANRVVAIQRSLTPTVEHACIVIFAADHGVTAEGVAPYPSAVTGQMVANLLAGGAGVNALARVARADVHVVDIGVASDLGAASGVHQRRVAPGTKNMAREPAMTRQQAETALAIGLEMGRDVIAAGTDMIGLGEMGIGNSTAASAVTAALTGLPVSSVTGRGTGADDAMLAHKVRVIEQALQQHQPDPADAFDVLSKVGGFELAGLAGVVLAAAAGRRVVVTDGFIATAAAALAVRLCPAANEYLFAAHRSPEPGHAALLAMTEQEPLLDLRMRLGEGTGAALAFVVIRAAVAAFTEMATFASAGVSNRSDLPDAV
ncbi:MAG: nicotinate-nucleotide--dimethylbenzimidazole phosphoribosyltransferase [Acidobacteria bacterium]|nr:MAG: nicotinate-nucleotide--dimethylbenzimidazole phosphoribosyltransferase [Acidobacteriota bacterium]PYR50339.1 MAG: nicotinate-nucleotide--dimethylbenzimidazole phosphoribosyltransferase [Acidobacteriota bacterium]